MSKALLGGTLLVFAVLLVPGAASACAVCFGAGTGDNPDAAGLNAGVGVLFAVLLPVQLLIALLFARVVRRSKLQQDARR